MSWMLCTAPLTSWRCSLSPFLFTLVLFWSCINQLFLAACQGTSKNPQKTSDIIHVENFKLQKVSTVAKFPSSLSGSLCFFCTIVCVSALVPPLDFQFAAADQCSLLLLTDFVTICFVMAGLVTVLLVLSSSLPFAITWLYRNVLPSWSTVFKLSAQSHYFPCCQTVESLSVFCFFVSESSGCFASLP